MMGFNILTIGHSRITCLSLKARSGGKRHISEHCPNENSKLGVTINFKDRMRTLSLGLCHRIVISAARRGRPQSSDIISVFGVRRNQKIPTDCTTQAGIFAIMDITMFRFMSINICSFTS
jgi:hypothetical protein